MRKTKSFTYIFPMLRDVIKYKPSVANVFIGDENYPSMDGNIFVLYKFSASKEFLAYEEDIKSHNLYVTAYDPDEKHLMMVFKVLFVFVFRLVCEGNPRSNVTSGLNNNPSNFR